MGDECRWVKKQSRNLEPKNLGKIWNLAKKSTAGFEIYASQLASLFKPKSQVLEQLIFVLFNIAISDDKNNSCYK